MIKGYIAYVNHYLIFPVISKQGNDQTCFVFQKLVIQKGASTDQVEQAQKDYGEKQLCTWIIFIINSYYLEAK